MKKKIYFILLSILLIGCSIKQIKRPKEWTVIDTGKRPFVNPFGRCNLTKREIQLMPPVWLPKNFASKLILNHELAHAWGLKGCKHMYCLMYEPEAAGHSDDNVFFEFLAKPFQLFYGFKLCPECRAKLEQAIEYQREMEEKGKISRAVDVYEKVQ